MRIAAGILMILYGAGTLLVYVGVLITHVSIFDFDPFAISPFTILFMISAAFIVTGGVFCLTRKYWKLCFASALLAVLMMIFLMPGVFWSRGFPLSTPAWWMWSLIITGALPIIFVCIKKREWLEFPVWMDFA
jgi:hypothetical protein